MIPFSYIYVTLGADSKLRGPSTFSKTYTYDWHIDPAALGSVSVIGAVFIADSWNPMANQAKLTIAPNKMRKKWSDTGILIWNKLFFIWNFSSYYFKKFVFKCNYEYLWGFQASVLCGRFSPREIVPGQWRQNWPPPWMPTTR